MKIRIFTNEVAGGWWANDLDNFLGGSEECVVLLAEALVRSGFQVTVYHTFPFQKTNPINIYKRKEVTYQPREFADSQKGDILITFKDNLPWIGGETDASIKIHWSSEVEKPWKTNDLDYFVNLTPYHKFQNVFVRNGKSVVVPHGIDTKALVNDSKGMCKEANTILYCSSPDRGLLPLLSNWNFIHKFWPNMRLNVAYGFKNTRLMHSGAKIFENSIMSLIKRSNGVTYLGQLKRKEIHQEYGKSEYWALPLVNPRSELFCLNAIKARVCHCTPIINRIGALKHTASKNYIKFKQFVNGVKDIENEDQLTDNDLNPILNWDEVVKNYWIPMFEKKL